MKAKKIYTEEEREVFRKRGKKSKAMGHGVERLYVNLLKELGWLKAKTCRLASRLLDNCRVDVAFVPMNIQIKAGTQRGLKPAEELEEMERLLDENLPDDASERRHPNVVIHHKVLNNPKDAFKSRKPTDAICYMTVETFFDLMQRLHDKGKYAEVRVFIKEEGELREVEDNDDETFILTNQY